MFAAGDILLFRGRGPVSTAIALASCWPSQWIRGCAPSHVGILIEHEGSLLLAESTTLCELPCELTGMKTAGVQFHMPRIRLESYKGHVWHMPVSRDWAPLEKHESERLTRFCISHVGDSYDFDNLLWFPLERLTTFLRPPKHHTICSRFVAKAAAIAGLAGRGIIPASISPGYIARTWPRTEVYDEPRLILQADAA